MVGNICGFVTLFAVSIAVALVVYALLRRSLASLLDEVINLPSGTTFYSRLFLIGLVFIALSSVLDVTFELSANSVFMEYVWKVADGLSAVFGFMSLFLFGFLVLLTILVAVLRRRHDQ